MYRSSSELSGRLQAGRQNDHNICYQRTYKNTSLNFDLRVRGVGGGEAALQPHTIPTPTPWMRPLKHSFSESTIRGLG